MNKTNSVNTVIFDLDGTLLNTLDDLTSSVNYCMEKYHCPTHTVEQVRSMVGNGIYVLLERALPGGRQSPNYDSCIRDFQTHYKAHMMDQTKPFDGIYELLTSLKEQNFKLAIVSNKFDTAVKGLNQTFFANYVSVAIGESESIARKPAPDTVYQAMKELNANPDACIYVGDSEVDIQTAKNAGIPCISVNWGFKDNSFLQEHGASCIVSSPQELLEAILHS